MRTAGVRYNRDVNYESSREPGGYEQFFGFCQPPFSLAPDTRFRFDSASHSAALKEITYALERREPIVVVTGEIGTGKTLLCRTVIERSDRKTFVASINDPQLQRDDLLTRMLEDFGVVSKDRGAARAPIARHELVHALQEFLGSLAPIQAHAVVILDEAQHAQPDVLEQIRLISNIQDDRGTLLQIMLVGQPGLNDLLAQPELRQLTQRVSRFARLEPLTAPEVTRYIGHRLAVARERTNGSPLPGATDLERELAAWDGSQPDAPFTPDAIAAVAQISGGIPRVVNLLCDRALEAGYRAGLRTVDVSTINTAAAALGLAAAKPAAAALPVWPQLTAEDGAATPAPEPPAASSARRYGAIAATVAVVAIAWFGVRSAARRSPGEPVSRPAPAPAPQPARPAQGASTPAAPREPAAPAPATEPIPAPSAAAPSVTTPAAATAPRTAGSATAAPAAAAGAFEIVVASFRTEARAADVVTAITALGEPVQRRFLGGWQQVVAGPYASDDLVRAAQRRLERAGFSGTHITPSSR